MRIEVLTKERLQDFITYCRKHKMELDDSFLYEVDLRDFTPDENNPTYIAIDEQGAIIAAASLIIGEYNRRGKKGRFRIFHSEEEHVQTYSLLLREILKHTAGLNKLNIFVPIVNERLMNFMEGIDFKIERYSFLLVRDNPELPEVSFPEGYEIRPYRKGLDEAVWCEVRNAGFTKLQGSETPTTPELVAKMASGEDYLEGGMMILYHQSKPVGVVRGAMDEYEDAPIMNIGPLAILPEYQGKGLGRSLLRASLHYAKQQGYDRTVLCVNAENDRAKALYLQESFKQAEAVVCYKYEIVSI